QSARGDVRAGARGELCPPSGARSAELPQELGDREKLVKLDAARDVNAVHAERGELIEQLLIRLALDTRRHAVEKDVSANHVDAKHLAVLQVRVGDVADLLELLSDHRMAGRICPRQPAERRQTFEYVQAIGWCSERRRARFAATSRALTAPWA